jgi:hypothetical protein
MSRKQTFHYCMIQYRQNPMDPRANTKTLGFVVGFSTPKVWAICIAMRASIEADFLASLDPLSREILESRSKIITSEVDAVISSDKSPDMILAEISQRNSYSLFVTSPRQIELEVASNHDESVEKAAEGYVLTLYSKIVEIQKARTEKTIMEPELAYEDAESARMSSDAFADISIDIPPPWMLPLTYRFRPIV